MRRFALAALLLLAALPAAARRLPITFDGADLQQPRRPKIAHGKRLADILGCQRLPRYQPPGTRPCGRRPQDGAMYVPNVTLLTRQADNDADVRASCSERRSSRRAALVGHAGRKLPVPSGSRLDAVIAYLRTFKPAGEALPPVKSKASGRRTLDTGVLGNARSPDGESSARHLPIDLGAQHALWPLYHRDHMRRMPARSSRALQGWPNFTPNLDHRRRLHARRSSKRLLTSGHLPRRGKYKNPLIGVGSQSTSHISHRSERDALSIRSRSGGAAAASSQIFTRLSGARYSFCPGCTLNAGYQASMLRTVSARNCAGAWPSVSDAAAQRSRRVLRRPGLGKGEEEALVAGEAVDHRRWLAVQRRLVGVVGGGEAGDVGDILAERQLAVEVQAGQRLIGVDTARPARRRPP